ncbi:TRAP transporter small permease subunit [Martelella sp. HB161492]|uniref:TRAP transporter small permease n=1 Tax=Martelella sp. HB161492 TaxID=2720726 RepID=UPI001591D798|nr:TRAP transporter small permease subunit [Martelella sp. HB161492]
MALEEHHTHRLSEATDDPKWLRAISHLSTVLNRIAAFAAACILVFMTAFTLLEICLRLFSKSTFMADALVGNGVAAVCFLSAAWALEEGFMIRVKVITDRVGPKIAWACEFFTLIAVEALLLFMAHYQWKTVYKYWSRGTVSETYLPIPLFIPESFFLIGLGLMALQIIVRLLRLLAVGHAEERALTL